jgi:hypothetical protein
MSTGQRLVGVDYSEDDRYSGPFRIRVGGSNDYVIKIDPDDRRCSPPGSVEYGAGCDGAMVFDDFDEALSAAASVFEIDGVHVSIMAYGRRSV